MVADSLLTSFGAVIGRDMAVDLGTATTDGSLSTMP